VPAWRPSRRARRGCLPRRREAWTRRAVGVADQDRALNAASLRRHGVHQLQFSGGNGRCREDADVLARPSLKKVTAHNSWHGAAIAGSRIDPLLPGKHRRVGPPGRTRARSESLQEPSDAADREPAVEPAPHSLGRRQSEVAHRHHGIREDTKRQQPKRGASVRLSASARPPRQGGFRGHADPKDIP